MLLRQVEYLVALAREGHFGRAAEACHVSQPALSAGIRKLEAELGVQVVKRAQRFEGFTPEGEQVLRWGQRVVAERAALGQTLAEMRSGLSGTLRIGAIPTAMTVAPLLTGPLHAAYPLVRFSLESMSSREIATRLNDLDVDVGLTYVDGEPLGRVRVVPLYRERYLFLTPREGDFSGRTSIGWAEAATAPLCLLAREMQNRRALDGFFAEAGAAPEPVVETDTISSVYAHVATMRLSSVIPHTWLHGFGVPPEVVALPLPQPGRPLSIGLVLAGSGPESPLCRALVETARAQDLHGELERVVAERLGGAD